MLCLQNQQSPSTPPIHEIQSQPGCANNACAPDPNPTADCIANCGPPSAPAGCPSGQACSGNGQGAGNSAANNGPTIGPPQEWHPAKQPSALSKYVAFLGCYGVSVSRTITDEEDGQGGTAYGFINAGAILAIRSGAVFTPVGYTFVATAGLMDLSAGVKANQECTAAIYH